MTKPFPYLLASMTITAALVGLPVAALAATFLSEGNADFSQAVDDDVYAAGQVVSVRGDVQGDVMAGGSTVEVTKNVTGDVIAAGQSVMVRGAVGDDVIAAGSALMIEPTTVDDVIAAGSSVLIGQDTHVTGDVYLAGATVVLRGKIDGNVKVAADTIRLGNNTEINGDLLTYGDTEPTIIAEDGALVRGERHHYHLQANARQKTDGMASWTGMVWITDIARRIVTWSILAWLLILIAPSLATRIIKQQKEHPGKSFVWGLGWMVACVPAVFILVITVIGIPAAGFIGIATIALGILAVAYAHVITGAYLAKYVFKGNEERKLGWREALVGALALAIIRAIPILGWLTVAIITLMTLGSILVTIGRAIRTPAEPTITA